VFEAHRDVTGEGDRTSTAARSGTEKLSRNGIAVSAIVCGALLLRASFEFDPPCTLDDAFISFQYAKNLASGAGLVFNPGDYVWGYTAPLYVLLLGGLGALGISIVQAAIVLGVLASCATALIWERLLSRFLPPFWALGLALFCLTNRTSFLFRGMETTLLLALQSWALLLIIEGRAKPAWFVSALACLTRPDSLLLVVPALLLSKRMRSLSGLVWFAVPGLLWLGFALYYYGDWLPNSLHAKQGRSAWWEIAPHFARYLNSFPLSASNRFWPLPQLAEDAHPLILVALCGLNLALTLLCSLSAGLRRMPALLWALLGYPWVLLFAYCAIGTPQNQDWEIQSAFFFNQMALAIGLASGARYCIERWHSRRRSAAYAFGVASAVLCAFVVTRNAVTLLESPVWEQRYFWLGARERAYRNVITWVDANLPRDWALIASEPGILAFYSDRRIIDGGRIVSRWANDQVPRLWLAEGVQEGRIGYWRKSGMNSYTAIHYFPAGEFRDMTLLALKPARGAALSP